MIADICRRCQESGDDVAVVDDGVPLSGAELLERARSLSSDLQDLGVTPGARVALSMAPCSDLYVSIVATWLAGAAFVPIDPEEAPGRRARILAVSQASVVLSLPSHNGCPETGSAPWAAISGGRVVSVSSSTHVPGVRSPWADEAYVIFTSGSTGPPKGVSVGHRAIAAYVREARRTFAIPDSGMVFPLQFPPTFDAALTSLLPPLVTRNVAVPVTDPVSATRGLAQFLARTTAPVLVKTTPSQLSLLRGLLHPADVDRLAGVFVIGGEALAYDRISWLRQARGLRIFNEYGPTEATVGCAVYEVTADDPGTGPVPIGVPHHEVSFSLSQGPHAAGEAGSGELVIAGPCVANGYVNEGDRGGFTHTAGQRRYRTGDRVRRDGAGRYHFLGRVDGQLKVNGFRIELGEIEEALRLACGCRQAAAALIDGTILGLLEAAPGLDIDAVTADLRRRLPSYLLPSGIRIVPAIPLTAHGKIDRGALLTLLATPDAGLDPLRAPRQGPCADTLPALVTGFWCTLLGLDSADSDTDFFSAGDSITALRLMGRLAEALGQEIPVSLIFDNARLDGFIGALRDHLQRALSAGGEEPRLDEHRTPGPSQLSILDAEQWSPDEAIFTVVNAVHVKGLPSQAVLDAAITATLARHDIFTWRFTRDEKDAVAAFGGRSAAGMAGQVETIDLRALPATQAEAAVAARLASERQQRINLLADVPAASLRVLVFRTGPDAAGREAGVCALVAHHALLDEISAGLVWDEVFARAGGMSSPAGYDDRYEHWAREMAGPAARRRAARSAEEIASRLCAAPIGAIPLAAHPGPSEPLTSRPVRFSVPPELSARCADAAKRFAVPVAALYGAAVVRALGPVIRAPRFALFMPMTLRRSEPDFMAVGCYVASVPVLGESPPGAEPAAAAVTRWHRSVGFAAERADADPSHLAGLLQASAPGWFTAARVSLAIERPLAGRCGPVEWSSLPQPDHGAKYDLSVFLTPGTREKPGSGRLVWRNGCADRAMAISFADGFLGALDELCAEGALSPPGCGDAPPSAPAADTAAPDTSPQLAGQPSGETELGEEIGTLAGMVLGQRVAPGSDLFQAGARSLDLIRLTAEIKRRYEVTLSAVDIFDCPTPASLARLITTRRRAAD